MTFLDRLEHRFGRISIPGLTRYVAAFNILVYCLLFINPDYASVLALDYSAIKQGEIWRLITWIFIPRPTGDSPAGPLFVLLYIYSIWWMGDHLETIWGSFRLTVYYVLGMIGCTIAAFLFGSPFGSLLLNLSLFLAVAALDPELEILVMMILPVKIKWVALFSLIFPWGLLFIGGGLGTQLTIVICLLNLLLFFGPAWLRSIRDKRHVTTRRAKFESAKDTTPYLHKCETCGITELTNPDTDFRVTEDGREYCTPHLPK